MRDVATRVEYFRNGAQRKQNLLGFIVLSFVFLFAALSGARAQDNASITGTVLDPSGAAVANASIKITNVATGQVRQGTSNSAGVYLFANVGVGTYNLSATAAGFQ